LPSAKAAAAVQFSPLSADLLAQYSGHIVTVGTISQYKIDPGQLALVGVCLIVGQLILRILGDLAYPIDEGQQKEKDIERIANYANTRIHS
jgi:hypothetical protein